jgi:general secretion pathway protein I
MKTQRGMTLLEVLVALVVFALAGLALLQTTAQQASGIGRMQEKMLASWLADNQQVQLHLEKVWPELSWSDKTVTFAGEQWYVRWRGVESEISQLRALDVEVRHKKQDATAVVTLRSYAVRQ